MRKRKVKRYNGEEDSYVEDYASLGKRAAAKEKEGDYAYDPISKVTGEAEMSRAKRMEDMDKGGGERGPTPIPSSVPERAKTSGRIVSKKELEQSGLSLRDFLNRERGLKRRGSSDEDESVAERRMTAIGDKWREEKKSRESAAVPKASKEEMDRRKKMEKEQALETVSPESNLIGGPGLKLVQKGAKALAASQAAKAAARVPKPRVEPSFRPIKDITPGPEQIRMAPRQIGMKSGGKVSASKRADGIAQRGKTRGRIY